MSATGPLYAGAAADTGTNAIGVAAEVWANLSNATGVDDGNFATNTWPSGGDASNGLKLTGFNFNIPTTAVIDGIVVEFMRQGSAAATYQLNLVKAGTIVTATAKAGTDGWPSVASEAYTTYGADNDLWGTNWSPADINDSGFGLVIYAYNTHGGGEGYVDAARITVYWHTAPSIVPKAYRYKVYSRGGQYLGDIPNVTSDFEYTWDINTGGSSMVIKSGVSADVAGLLPDELLDEDGNPLLDESGDPLLAEENPTPIISLGTGDALLRDGNEVIVYEYGYWNPNGKAVFRGQIQNIEAPFGGSEDDNIEITVYSDGYDLNEHIVRGSPYTFTADQVQALFNNSLTITNDKLGDQPCGQSWKPGVGVTNCAKIVLPMYGTADVTVELYSDATFTTLLGTVSQHVSVGGWSWVNLAFSHPVAVVAGTQYWFKVRVGYGQSIQIRYTNSNPYANGQMYQSQYVGAGAYVLTAVPSSDLEFQTYSGNGSTQATYTSVDPTTGLVVPALQDYNAESGKVTSTSSSVQATGLSVTVEFNTNTVYEMLQTALTLCPNGFYYMVDLATNLLTMKAANNVADLTLTRGYHIEKFRLRMTIEQLMNYAFFTGGEVAGANIYTIDSDVASESLYGQRLDRPTNNQVTDTPTAHIIGQHDVARNKDEQFGTTVTVYDYKFDLTLLKPGLVVGFNGFGSFIDDLLLQIVRVERKSQEATLTLGILPKRLHQAVEQTVRGYIGLQTVVNPSAPS